MGAENSRRPVSLNIDLILHKKYCQMERIRRTFNFQHKKKENMSKNTPENKLRQWQNDEKSVRAGNCSFHVKYLGSIEVKESRGMDVCEQAIEELLNHKMKHVKAVIHISGDALRVVDGTNKGLIVDQTLEKVSFCAPDRQRNKGFAYICRDGTTRRWICHGFVTIKETGERLSHAVGCAFQTCLERKQTRGVIVEYSQNGTSFTRFGSFRKTSIIERIIDPQSAIIAEPIPYPSIIYSPHQKPNVIERPRPKGKNSDGLFRSISMNSSDFNQRTVSVVKRQSSLGHGDLPSIQEAKYKNSSTKPISEEAESTKPSTFWQTNSQPTNPINDAFNSNLSALAQSNHPTNPFSPYAYSIAAQAQSPNTNQRQSVIFTPKRGTNPFDDDLIRR